MWNRRHLLGLEELSRGEILTILDKAEAYREIATQPSKKTEDLAGKVVVTLFFEPSTRTLTSFTVAAKRLCAEVINFSRATSSTQKGETLLDTARNIEAMGVDVVIVRHSAAGVPLMLSRVLRSSIVNAGDGAHEHPTQALLDIFTIRRHLGKIKGLKVAIVGDIAHSRVARSNIWGLRKLGAKVFLCGPATLVPTELEALGVKINYNLDDLIRKVDVINVLRIQLERQRRNPFPSIREYVRLFGLNARRLKEARKDLLILHPGPINRGVEMTSEVADGGQSAVLEQVSNGVAIRMAVLSLIASARGESREANSNQARAHN